MTPKNIIMAVLTGLGVGLLVCIVTLIKKTPAGPPRRARIIGLIIGAVVSWFLTGFLFK